MGLGKLDELQIEKLPERLALDDPAAHTAITELRNRPEMSLRDRLRFVLGRPLADKPCVFVFDDFENGNLEPDGAGADVCTPEALQIVVAFANAIKATSSASRVIITSRYEFPLPGEIDAQLEPLWALRSTDLFKKLEQTSNFRSAARWHPTFARTGSKPPLASHD